MIRDVYNNCKMHADQHNVSTLLVLLDYIHARILYGFCGEDYFLNTPGYAMKNFLKKQYFSHKEWIKIRKKFNNENFTYILKNKVETLKYFKEFIKHDWCYPREHSIEQFNKFISRHERIISKPISEEGGKGVGLYRRSPSNYGGV